MVDSLAFRAYNRGLAAVSNPGPDIMSSTPAIYPVWKFNGTRWYPDPTFPGSDVCKGNTVLWAGKRDYWLIGERPRNRESRAWPRLCRFDGVDNAWQPLDVPPESKRNAPGSPKPGAITAGACFAWNDCWFFGDYGAVVRWNGQSLIDATPEALVDPSMGTDYTGAIARGAFGVAVGTSGGMPRGTQLPPRRDGSPPPQLYTSSGGPFAPLPFTPPSNPQPEDPYRTDLVAADIDANGRGWAAGDPTGRRPWAPSNDGRASGTASEPAPLLAISPAGVDEDCAGPAPERFMFSFADDGAVDYLWTSIAAIPALGAALAGGQRGMEAVLARVDCDGGLTETAFLVKDPQNADQANAPYIPANRRGWITSVAANAANDAWAATSLGDLPVLGMGSPPLQRPRLYRLTDGTPPAAPAGDDDEPRPPVFVEDPPIFVDAPPEPEPEPLPAPADTVTSAPPTTTTVKQKAAVYAVKRRWSKERRGKVTLYISFRVRRPVTIGVQALRRQKVVAKSGLKRFKGKHGQLVLELSRKRWPTRIEFVTPPAATPSTRYRLP